MGKGELGSWDGHVHAAILKMDQQHGPAVEHRELCSMLCGSLDGGEFGGEWIHKPRQDIKKQRHHFDDKGAYHQSYGFSSSHVWL